MELNREDAKARRRLFWSFKMNAYRFSRDLDAVLGRAAETLALALEIEHSLEQVIPCRTPETPWRL